MKKGAVTLVLAMVLSLSTVGCGNSAEIKQEEPQETEREDSTQNDEEVISQENDYKDIVGKEFENDNLYVKIESTERTFGINGDYTNEYKTLTTDKELTIYCDGGFEIGHLKQGATIEIELGTFNENPSAYYRFKNPISDLPFDYIYVGSLDCDMIFEASAEETPIIEEHSDPYDEILETVGYDRDKTYTIDEYIELLTNIFKEMGKEYNLDLAGMNPFDSYDGFHIQLTTGITDYTEENTRSLMNYIENSRDGWGGITEFCIIKAEKDGVEGINIFVKVDHEVVEKNMSEWQ